MADISYFDNTELESGDGTEDENGRSDDQQLGERGLPHITPLDRLIAHAASDRPGERQLTGKLLINVFQSAVKSKTPLNLEEIFDSIDKVVDDKEPAVRSSLVECLPHVALIYQETAAEEDLKELTDRILSIIFLYLYEQDNQVRQDAQQAFRMLLERKLLDERQIEQDVCNVIVELSCNQCPELQTLALSLMTKISPYIGDVLTEKLFLDRFLELCSSESFFVRRVCASIVGEFCTIMSKETIFNKLMLTYTNLCQDKMWGVRKTSVDVMMSVARCVPLSMRRGLLSKLLCQHLSDESRWVRRSAYEILGPFISTFAKQFHELICDQKGDLVLVHENERGWPRFNVVPVAKVSDILAENLPKQAPHLGDGMFQFEQLKEERRNVSVRRKVIRKEHQKLNQVIEDSNRLDSNLADEYESFNTFQYYHNPPDTMPLDPALVESIINDNEKWKSDVSKKKDIALKKQQTQRLRKLRLERFRRMESDGNPKVEESEQSDDNDNKHQDVQNQTDGDLVNVWENSEEDKTEEEDEEKKNDADDADSANGNDREFIESWADTGKTTYDEEPSNLQRHSSTSSLATMCGAEEDKLSKRSFPKLDPKNLDLWEPLGDEDDIVPMILINHFVSMAELQSNSNDIGPDLDYHCAFSFPAVVLTLGKENWHQLKDAYQALASAVAWKVRSTLASSIHEIASIIEKDLAARDLVPIYNGFIKDLDEVKIGALKHFATFLKVLSPQDRMQYLPKLNDFLVTDSKWNWRLREEFVKQLSEIILLYQRIDVAQYIAPLLLHLMQDRVAAVRQEALDAVAKTIAYLANQSDDALAIAMIQEMRDLLMAHATERWMIRQTYALVCSKLVSNLVVSNETFARELLPYLLDLTTDRVPNVRLVVARTLARDVVRIPDFPEMELMNQVQLKLKAMQSDNDRDVRIFASEVEEKFY